MNGIVLGIVILLTALGVAFGGTAAFGIVTYNKLVRRRNAVKNAFAQIDTQQQRKLDLIPNLLGTVKAYTTYEKELLDSVMAGRDRYLTADTNQEKLALSTQLSTDIKQLLALSNNNVELRGNANFLYLQEEFSEAEDKITFARQFYNDSVTLYNNKLQIFPNNIVAGIFGFTEEDLLYIDEN